MDILLPNELEQYVAEKVGSGMYQTSSDVIREALRLLRERDEQRKRFEELKSEIAAGIRDADAGFVVPLDAEKLLDEISNSRYMTGWSLI